MITDSEGLAWLRALEAELGEKTGKTTRIFDGFGNFPHFLMWEGKPTKDVPQPKESEKAFQHVIALVEKRVERPPY